MTGYYWNSWSCCYLNHPSQEDRKCMMDLECGAHLGVDDSESGFVAHVILIALGGGGVEPKNSIMGI